MVDKDCAGILRTAYNAEIEHRITLIDLSLVPNLTVICFLIVNDASGYQKVSCRCVPKHSERTGRVNDLIPYREEPYFFDRIVSEEGT